MDGYQLGVEKYNEDKSATSRSSVGTPPPEGLLPRAASTPTTRPSRPPRACSTRVSTSSSPSRPGLPEAAAAINDSGKDTLMLGVDSDLAVADPSVADITLVSIMKAIDVAVRDADARGRRRRVDPEPYIGTLENEGVKLSGFGDFEADLPEASRTSCPLSRSRSSPATSRWSPRTLPPAESEPYPARGEWRRLPLAPHCGRRRFSSVTLLDKVQI
ncbi:hypothetical protein AB1285_20215 [Microbacterium sp. NRRL B-14842]|uniref:hypothetical protein n=1 Tax=Microbacterium sp. NRRL B-14842 TaxID=3162881 RepID=UPI003D2C0FD2